MFEVVGLAGVLEEAAEATRRMGIRPKDHSDAGSESRIGRAGGGCERVVMFHGCSRMREIKLIID